MAIRTYVDGMRMCRSTKLGTEGFLGWKEWRDLGDTRKVWIHKGPTGVKDAITRVTHVNGYVCVCGGLCESSSCR